MASHTRVPPLAIHGRAPRTLCVAGEAQMDPAMCSYAAPADHAGRKWTTGPSGDARLGDLPNEAEINSMGVAELRQTMLGLVRLHKAACSQLPTSVASAAAAQDAIHAGLPPSPNPSSSYASATSLAALGGVCHAEAARSHHHYGPAAPGQQATRLGMLLNATTITDRADCCEHSLSQTEQLPSPPDDAAWGPGSRRLPALPPISRMAQSAPNESPFKTEAGGPSSLDA
ncbi:hypothetical protein IWQ56_006194, partial [Coemansia nantahalensis]